MAENEKPLESLREFARDTLRTRFDANTALNAQPLPSKPAIVSTFTSAPLTPVHFPPPEGRGRGTSAAAPADAVVVTSGAFYGQYVDTDSGDTYLQGGTVTGGTGTRTIDDIKVIDSGTGNPTHAAGQHMYIEATGSGVTSDGVLLPGWNLSSASVDYGATVPDNTLPTASSSSGKKCYVEIGVFTEDAFFPSLPGNISISFCPGSYTVSR